MPRSNLDEIVEDIRVRAGADFAFVLTRRGRLITVDAPREMPEPGRMRLVRAARPLIGTSQTVQVSLARQELVPYGGAAPVDVYLAVAREQAILCVVMATWGDKRPIIPSILEGLAQLEPVLDRKQGGGIPKARTSRPAPPPLPRAAPRTSAPTKMRRRGAMSGLVGLIGNVATPSPSLEQSPVIQNMPAPPLARPRDTSPDIVVGEAPLGRESLDAIDSEYGGSWETPAATHGGSLPEISVVEGRLGMASLEAIEAAGRVPVSSAPEVRVELSSMSRASAADLANLESELAESERVRPDPGKPLDSSRLTNPWSEVPADVKRSIEAQRGARGAQPPRLTLKLESLDEEALEAALIEEIDEIVSPPSEVAEAPKETTPSKRVPQPSYEVWRDAVDDALKAPPRRRKTD